MSHDDHHLTRRHALGAAGAGGVALLFGGLGGGKLLRPDVAEGAAATCTLTPAKTEGPYFVDEKLNRSDIRANTADGAVQAGVRLTLRLQVFDAENDCAPVQGATVDIWHANADGLYSDEAANSTQGQDWLRGYQTTDAGGMVAFTTIWPGWYRGRAVHIHFKVRSGSLEFTSQLFFTDAMNASVFRANSPYDDRGLPDTSDSADGIYGSDGTSLLLTPTASGGGYGAEFSVGISGGSAAVNAVDAALRSATMTRSALGARRLRLSIRSTEAITATAKLTRSGHRLAHLSERLATGTHVLKVPIPQAVKAGAARLTLTLKDSAGAVKTVTRTVHVRRQ